MMGRRRPLVFNALVYLFREVLNHFKIKRLTGKARSILEAAKELIPT